MVKVDLKSIIRSAVDHFDRLDPVDVEAGWAWLVDSGRIAQLIDLVLDPNRRLGDPASDSATEVFRRVGEDVVIAWLATCAVAHQIVDIVGPPPALCRWSVLPSLLPALASCDDVTSTMVTSCANSVLDALCVNGHPEPPLTLSQSGMRWVLTVLLSSLQGLHLGCPALAVAGLQRVSQR